MRRIAVAAGLGVVLLGASVNAARSSPAPSPVVSLASDRILVSEPGHRISEFSVATNPRNPNHVVVAAMDWDDDRGIIGCTTYISRDGGMSWKPGGEVPGYEDAFWQADPWVAFDGQGRVHLDCLSVPGDLVLYGIGTVDGTTGRPTIKQLYSRSDDGGATWSPARRLPTRHEKNQVDKTAIFASRAGTVYACYHDYPRKVNDLVVSRSFDAGDTWTKPMPLNNVTGLDGPDGEKASVVCNGFAEGRNGEVHLIWWSYAPEARYGTLTTTDGGKTWRSTTIADELWADSAATHGRGVPPAGALPAVTANPRTGEVFVTLQAWAGDQYEAKLYRSRDAGVSYEDVSLPSIPSTACEACHEMRPVATVDRAGRLGVQIMLTSDRGLTKEAWFLASPDGGDTWLEPVQVSGTGPDQWWGDPRNWVPNDTGVVTDILNRPHSAASIAGWGAATRGGSGGPAGHHINYGGDYWQIAASAKGFLALWEDNAENGKHQLWARIVRVTGRSSSSMAVPSESSASTQVSLRAGSTSPTGGSACDSVSQRTPESLSTARAPQAIAALVDRPGSSVMSLRTHRQDSYAEIASRHGVAKTYRSYRDALKVQGFEFVFSEYEGFEAELFGSKAGASVVVRIFDQCRGSSALVNVSK